MFRCRWRVPNSKGIGLLWIDKIRYNIDFFGYNIHTGIVRLSVADNCGILLEKTREDRAIVLQGAQTAGCYNIMYHRQGCK